MIKKTSFFKVFILIILSLLIIAVAPSESQAKPNYGGPGGGISQEHLIDGQGGSTGGDVINNPDAFKPGGATSGDIDVVTGKVNSIIGSIVTVGTVTSVITVTILGIKYMLGSVEEKAEYKKSMIPYLIGSVLLFAGSTIVSIIAKLVQGTQLAP